MGTQMSYFHLRFHAHLRKVGGELGDNVLVVTRCREPH